MAPNFSKLVPKFWKLVSKRKYALTSRKYSLTPRKYALTPREYALTSRKDVEIRLLRDFWTIFGFMAHPAHRRFTMILSYLYWSSSAWVFFNQVHHFFNLGDFQSLFLLWTIFMQIIFSPWARVQGYCKMGSRGQRKLEKIRATFWDSKKLTKALKNSKLL